MKWGLPKLGLAAMLVAARFDYHRLRLVAVPLLVVAMALLVAVLVPGVGVTAGGATRWLRFGGVAGLQDVVVLVEHEAKGQADGFVVVDDQHSRPRSRAHGSNLPEGRRGLQNQRI